MKQLSFVLCVFFLAGFLFPLLSCDFSFGGDTGEEESATWDTAPRLQDIYRNHFLLGNVVSPNDPGTVRFNLLKRHYSSATAENAMKPISIAPSVKPAADIWAYRWTDADKVVQAVNDAGLEMHGHTLVWHSQTPQWLSSGDKETVLNNLTRYVTEVTTHFKAKLISWDVGNEAMKDGLLPSDVAGGNWENCLRSDDNPWNKVIGPEYIEKAFLAARAADPDVKLFYNDYNLNNANKARAVYNMVIDINQRYPNVGGRPLIDGIGMQSHHHLYTDPQTIEASIQLFASLGVKIAISEMDIEAAGNLPGATVTWGEDAARRQAAQYAAMFRIFKTYASSISRVTFWGLDDGTSWKAGTHPTLLNSDFGLKPAFYAVANPERY